MFVPERRKTPLVLPACHIISQATSTLDFAIMHLSPITEILTGLSWANQSAMTNDDGRTDCLIEDMSSQSIVVDHVSGTDRDLEICQ